MIYKNSEKEKNTSGKPGRSNRLMSLRIILIPFLICTILSLLLFYSYSEGKGLVVIIFSIFTSVLFLLYRKIEKEVDKTYERGAEGEEKVFKYLKDVLPSEYYILNDIKIPNMERANIDHIVIGPTGIFIIETKNYSGKVTILDGKVYVRGKPYPKDIIKQVWHQTSSLKDFLKRVTRGIPIKIHPVIVFSKAYVTNPGKISGVLIIPLPFLKKNLLLKQSSTILADDLCRRLFENLKRYTNQPLN